MTNSEARKRESARNAARECACPYTDPSTWLSAASCGYGGGDEPGSMQEWNPDCPVHPATSELDAGGVECECPTDNYCPKCHPRWHAKWQSAQVDRGIGCWPPFQPDATVSDPAPLTDAEGDAWDALGEDTDIVCCCDGCNYYSPTYDASLECSIQTHVKAIVAARVAEAVEQERAARLALVAKIEALTDELAERLSTVRVAERIRDLLTADDTKATS